MNNKEEYFKIKFVFSKTGLMRYVSHLDVMRIFMRAARRAGFALYITKGFNPRVKLSFKRALKLGVESMDEEAEIALTKKMNPKIFKYRFNKQLQDGLRIREAVLIS